MRKIIIIIICLSIFFNFDIVNAERAYTETETCYSCSIKVGETNYSTYLWSSYSSKDDKVESWLNKKGLSHLGYKASSVNCELVALNEKKCVEDKSEDEVEIKGNFKIEFPSLGFGEENMSCSEVLGPSLVSFIKTVRVTVQGISTVAALANGMLIFATAVASKDSSAINKSLRKFAKMLVVLALILLLPTLVKFIGKICRFDLSCI